MEEINYINVPADLMRVISPEQAWHYRILPKGFSLDKLDLYADDSTNLLILKDELAVILGKDIELFPINASLIDSTLLKFFAKENRKSIDSATVPQPDTADFLMFIIKEAKDLGSSDIHIESYEERARVRIRIDGLMVERYVLDKNDYPALVNKIKIKANLDIAEKRLPQDGRIFFSQAESKFDIRVSIIPTLFGEKVVLRLLNNNAIDIDLFKLGFDPFDLENYLEGIKRPTGILLISGPTGSGKTTTLYATLKYLNKVTSNIITIEDPIEYTLSGINQVQLKENIGLNFASALRTFLRQDPDVIMVGEIRDAETANMAIRAALTGHLVLSTIHTNSAWGTISRLIDMGIPPFLLASTLNTSIAQRLVRVLCSHCKQKLPFDESLYPRNFKPFRKINTHFQSKGCKDCYFTGYKGRKAVYEVIPMDFELANEVKNHHNNITPLLIERKIKTLAENAFQLFENGITSIDEIYPLLFNY